MKAIDRLSKFIEMKGMNPKEFEESCGLSNGYVGKQKKKKGAIGSDILEKIALKYPDLNLTWLVTDNGYPIIKTSKVSKEDALATQKVEEEQAVYKSKNKGLELIQEGLDILQSALKKEKEIKKKN